MSAGPELAKLTTIFADSTSSRQRRLTPKQRHTMLRSATTGFTSILLKNSNFGLDHNLEDRWQPQWKFPYGLR